MAGQLLGKLTSPQLVENRKTLFLLVFLALSAVVISILQAWTFVQGFLENERIVEESTFIRLTNLRQQAALQLSNNALTLQFISQSPVLISFASSSEADQKMLRELFASVLVARPEFFQLRLLDLTGHEKLRVAKVNGARFRIISAI